MLKFSKTHERRQILSNKQRFSLVLEARAYIRRGHWDTFNLNSSFVFCAAFHIKGLSLPLARQLQFYVDEGARLALIRKFSLRLTPIACGSRSQCKLNYHGGQPQVHAVPGQLLAPAAIKRIVRLGKEGAPYVRDELYLSSDEKADANLDDSEDPAKCLFFPLLTCKRWAGSNMLNPLISIMQVVLRVELVAMTDDADYVCGCVYSDPFEISGNYFTVPDFDNNFYEKQFQMWENRKLLPKFPNSKTVRRNARESDDKENAYIGGHLQHKEAEAKECSVNFDSSVDNVNSSCILADSPKINLASRQYSRQPGKRRRRGSCRSNYVR